MRIFVLALLAVNALVGCGGSGTSTPTTPVQGDTPQFNLPLPSELDALAGAPRPAAARGVSRLMRQTGDLFVPALPSNNVTSDPMARTSTLPGDPADFAYCMYRIDGGIFGATQLVEGLFPELEWTGAPPSEGGVWIGFADYSSNAWQWFGPFVNQSGWWDTTAANLMGRSGDGYFAVVNYSNVEVTLHALDVRYSHWNSEDDQWIYFSHYDPANPSYMLSLSRIRQDGSEREAVFVGAINQGFAYPQVGDFFMGEPWLVYRLATPSNFQMMSVALAGGMTYIEQSSSVNLIPGGWNPHAAQDRYFWLQDLGTGKLNLFANNLSLPEMGFLSRMEDDIRDPVWDWSELGPTYAALFTLMTDVPTPRSIIATIQSDAVPVNETPVSVVDNGVETACDPASFWVLNGLGGYNYGFLFASMDRDDTSYNLYRYQGQTNNPDTKIVPVLVDAGYDFRSPVLSPDASRIAFIRMAVGADRGTLYVMDSMTGSLATATALADDVAAKLCWYDPWP